MYQSAATVTRPFATPTEAAGGGNAFIPVPLVLQYWQAVKRRKLLIFAIIAAALMAGLVVTLLMTPQYTAQARIKIDREEVQVTNVQGLQPDNAGQDQEFYATQYALLETDTLARRVARELRLANNPNFFAAHGVDQGEGLSSPAVSAADRSERERLVAQLLLEHVSISPVRGSALVDVSYTSADAGLSTQIANAWVEQFIAHSIDTRFASTSDARAFLEERLAELRTRLEQSERDAVDYASRRGIISLGRTQDAEGRTVADRTLTAADLDALNTALSEATAARAEAQSRARTGGGGGLADVANNPAIAQLRQARAEAQAEYAKLMVQFEPGYPAARALREEIQALDRSIAQEEARARTARTNAYQEALARENQLRSMVSQLKQDLDRQQRDSIQYNIYQREADTNRQLYDALLQRYKEIGVAGVGSNNASIVDPAEAPREPSSPNLPLNLAFALLGGLLLAGTSVVALEQIDEGIRDPSQVPDRLGAPLLGSVPEIDGGRDMDAIEQLQDPKSVLSEAYMSVRSTLAFSTDHGLPRSIMVTSTRPAEGKSTSSVAVATVLARSGKSVALIDADMRSPSLHRMLDHSNERGLSNFLSGDGDWRSLIRSAPLPSLKLITAGPMPPSAAELLSTERARMLVEELSREFDYVVIDAPPILGLADAPLLSQAVEGVVFVVESEGVSVRGIRAALDRLTAVNANLLGVLLTRLQKRDAGYGYGYGYDYSYGDTKAA